MKYRFILSYKSTDSDEVVTRQVSPLYGDDPNVAIERVNDEWYYTRKLGGKFTFVREDYSWIMARQFDGTYTMTVECSTDGISWQGYFVGTFSRASLTIDEDNKNAVLDGLSEGTYNVIENAKDTEYDLRKVIPDTEAKEVQGEIWPALALVDEHSATQKVSTSNIYCNGYSIGGGFDEGVNNFWAINRDMRSVGGDLVGILVEASFVMEDKTRPMSGFYSGSASYQTKVLHGSPTAPDADFYKTTVVGTLYNQDRTYNIQLRLVGEDGTGVFKIRVELPIGDYEEFGVGGTYQENTYYSPLQLYKSGSGHDTYESITIKFHYIQSYLLTAVAEATSIKNILMAGPYYEYISMRSDVGIYVTTSTNTSEIPNGYRLISGTDLYFAPPIDDTGFDWHPLSEDSWDYASLWYTVIPLEENGLRDRSLMGAARWTRCWTLGTIIKYLLSKVSSDKVHFEESESYSQFLYATVNPLEGGEQWTWLFCQKSDVMRRGDEGSTRCPARLNWFLEYMKNALNCYWWLEKRNDGDYDFHVEHVEYFRRGNSYVQGDGSNLIDITKIKPLRNFPRRGEAAKRLSDQTNKYTFDPQGMAERYTFSWQGEGGSDEFKGNPMLFKAGWIEEGMSEDRQVDNIFADLSWLTLNAGTDTDSSKNYDGLMVFAGYQPAVTSLWTENSAPSSPYITLASGPHLVASLDICLTAPQNTVITLVRTVMGESAVVEQYVGTGSPQMVSVRYGITVPGNQNYLRLVFGSAYSSIVIHRVHATSVTGNVYLVPNTESELTEGVYLQNGPLAWPSLQVAYLHYDVPAAKWSYDSDDPLTATFQGGGTVKLIKKQDVNTLPVPDLATEQRLKEGIRTGLGTGILDSATVNLVSRNAEMTLVYDITPLVS